MVAPLIPSLVAARRRPSLEKEILQATPQLFADGVHLTSTSPCIGAGTNEATGTDIFGNAWSNPPSVGCAEWQPAPVVMSPQIQLTGDPVGFTVGTAAIAGQTPFTFGWFKDGAALQDNGHFSSAQTTNLIATGVSFSDAGNYQLVVSNSFGVVTSAVAPLIIHFVDAAGTNPVTPYLNWTTAATNIQDAITAATAGDVILVTNGFYASGGKSMDGVITNRVSVDKAILLQSVNGANATIVQGAWDPASTNGPGAVRCAWMTNKAIMSGFTLGGGATRSASFPYQYTFGGGVWGSSNAILDHCVLSNNYAGDNGGGGYGANLNYCTLIGNCANQGYAGGAQNCNLKNCALVGNDAVSGGAAYQGTLINCTITGNRQSSAGGAVEDAALTNCLVYGNVIVRSGTANYSLCNFSYSDTDPLPSGTGNIDVNPQLLADGIHLAETSPCIGAGNAGVVSGTDIDGQRWNNPPGIGCDEWQAEPIVVRLDYQIGTPLHGLTFSVTSAGQAPFSYFWSKDGTPIQDNGHYSDSDTASLTINHLEPDDAGAYQVVVTNSSGIATSTVVSVVIHAVDASGMKPVPPYFSWSNAAANIQDAINAASAGDIVLVTNGIYSNGGMVMAGDLTNRVTLNKAITVMSVNGYKNAIIQGAWDPGTTNGPGAVRCAWLADGAVLNGFTLENGSTLASGDYIGGPLESGGGVWCNSTNSVVSNCVLTNNAAIYGGGIAYGTLNNSLVIGNYAASSAGSYAGAGTFGATLNNCTVELNYNTNPSGHGAGTSGGQIRNSIVINNFDAFPPGGTGSEDDYSTGSSSSVYYSYCCTSSSFEAPSLVGSGNIINKNPGFLDLYHISSLSPCHGTDSPAYVSGVDLDDESWNAPPSIGCDEVIASNLIGPLSVTLSANLSDAQTNLLVSAPGVPLSQHYGFFQGNVLGRAAYLTWSFGDGIMTSNSGASISHYWTNTGDYAVTFTAYNNDNPGGVPTNIIVHVVQPDTPQLQPPVILTNGIQFSFTGQTNANYTIQFATNLVPPVSWQTLQTIYYNYQNPVKISDSSTNITRFYRVLAQ